MLKIYTLVTILIFSFLVNAQSPQQFSYQAIVRGVNNQLIVSKQISMRISLLQGSENGNAVYVETQLPNTNTNGLVSVSIGSGVVVSGAFSTIDWAKGPYFVKTEIDLTGGINYTLTSISQLLSVPYALFSANSRDEQKLSVSSLGDTLYLSNGGFVIIPGISNSNPKPKPTSGYGPDIKDVEGNVYKTVYIGSQHWMAENLKVSKLNDGTSIPFVVNNQPSNYTPSVWAKLSTMAFTYLNNDEINNNEYGKLYNGYVISSSKVCPLNWHVPTSQEWDILIKYLGDTLQAGWKMKEIGNKHWSVLNTNILATNTSLFTALPGGALISGATGGGTNNFAGFNVWATWWSNSESLDKQKYISYLLNAYDKGLISKRSQPKTNGYSIRCLKD